MSTNLLILLSIIEAVILVAVLAAALIEIRRRLVVVSDGLSSLASALVTVETQHLRPLGGALTAVNERATTLLGLLPVVAGKAEVVVKHAQAQQ